METDLWHCSFVNAQKWQKSAAPKGRNWPIMCLVRGCCQVVCTRNSYIYFFVERSSNMYFIYRMSWILYVPWISYMPLTLIYQNSVNLMHDHTLHIFINSMNFHTSGLNDVLKDSAAGGGPYIIKPLGGTRGKHMCKFTKYNWSVHIQPIAFGMSILQSQFSISDLVY